MQLHNDMWFRFTNTEKLLDFMYGVVTRGLTYEVNGSETEGWMIRLTGGF